MPITAKSILEQVVKTLQDKNTVRWKTAELCEHFNHGQREIARLRPDQVSTRASVELVVGARQTLPAEWFRAIKFERNTAGTKRAITPFDRDEMDAQLPGWEGMTASKEIRNVAYDPAEPKTFLVFPPAALGASLDLVGARTPAAIGESFATLGDVTGNMDLPDAMALPLKHFVLAEAFDKDGTHPENRARAAGHRAQFLSALKPMTAGEGADKKLAQLEASA